MESEPVGDQSPQVEVVHLQLTLLIASTAKCVVELLAIKSQVQMLFILVITT